MADTFISGKSSSILNGTVSQSFQDWTLSSETKELETSNFNTAGYRTWIMGLTGGTVSVNGNYSSGTSGSGGAMPYTEGNSYALTLGLNATLTIVIAVAYLTKIELKSEIDGTVHVSLTFRISGSYTAAIV